MVQVVLVLLTPLSLLWSLLRSLPSFSVTHSGPLRNVGGGVPKSPSFSFSIDPHIAKKVHKTGRIAFEIEPVIGLHTWPPQLTALAFGVIFPNSRVSFPGRGEIGGVPLPNLFTAQERNEYTLYSSRAFPLLPDYFGRGEFAWRVPKRGLFPPPLLSHCPFLPFPSTDMPKEAAAWAEENEAPCLPTCLAPLLAHILSFSRTVQVHTSPSLPSPLSPAAAYVRPSSFVCTSPPPYTRPYTQRMKVWK